MKRLCILLAACAAVAACRSDRTYSTDSNYSTDMYDASRTAAHPNGTCECIEIDREDALTNSAKAAEMHGQHPR